MCSPFSPSFWRRVRMCISTVRQKLGENGEHIETVRGVGYRWEAEKK